VLKEKTEPKNLKQLQQFRDYAKIATPLNKLLKAEHILMGR